MNSGTTLKHYFNGILWHIYRNDLTGTTGCVQRSPYMWHLLFGLNIIVVFISQAAHQATTNTGDFRWIERETLLFRHLDRKSTRLNSSHTVISYAVFCLKKK